MLHTPITPGLVAEVVIFGVVWYVCGINCILQTPQVKGQAW